jgi:hypothetical protein
VYCREKQNRRNCFFLILNNAVIPRIGDTCYFKDAVSLKKKYMKQFCIMLLLVCSIHMVNAQLGQKVQGAAGGGNLAGTWVYNTPGGNAVTLLLYDNGQGELDGEAVSWTTSGKKLVIKSGGSSIQYNYLLSQNSLTLSGGDISKPAVFTRNGGGQAGNNAHIQSGSTGKDLLGTWLGQGMQFTFKPGGKMQYNDKTMDYTVTGNTLYCNNAQAGVHVTYQYEISQGHLMLSYNGNVLMLKKKSGGEIPAAANQGNGGKPGFLGSWVSSNNEHLTLMEGGRMTLEGYDLTYTYDASTITVKAPAGNVVFTYKLSGNNLTVTNNGVSSYYQRDGSRANGGNSGGGNTGGYGGRGSIDQSMVGKWSIMSTSGGGYNSSGTSSQSEYFILNANGTYEYYSESSRSANANDQYGNETINGGTSGGGYDRGTWSVKGNVLIANSQTRGVTQYPFQKRNNKNGDPCIVIDGTEYVSYYQKAPWR